MFNQFKKIAYSLVFMIAAGMASTAGAAPASDKKDQPKSDKPGIRVPGEMPSQRLPGKFENHTQIGQQHPHVVELRGQQHEGRGSEGTGHVGKHGPSFESGKGRENRPNGHNPVFTEHKPGDVRHGDKTPHITIGDHNGKKPEVKGHDGKGSVHPVYEGPGFKPKGERHVDGKFDFRGKGFEHPVYEGHGFQHKGERPFDGKFDFRGKGRDGKPTEGVKDWRHYIAHEFGKNHEDKFGHDKNKEHGGKGHHEVTNAEKEEIHGFRIHDGKFFEKDRHGEWHEKDSHNPKNHNWKPDERHNVDIRDYWWNIRSPEFDKWCHKHPEQDPNKNGGSTTVINNTYNTTTTVTTNVTYFTGGSTDNANDLWKILAGGFLGFTVSGHFGNGGHPAIIAAAKDDKCQEGKMCCDPTKLMPVSDIEKRVNAILKQGGEGFEPTGAAERFLCPTVPVQVRAPEDKSNKLGK